MAQAAAAGVDASSASRETKDNVAFGVRLFAASARNLVPRLISSVAVAGVAFFCLGPAWSLGWFVSTWAAMLTGVGLASLIRRRAGRDANRGLGFALIANNVVSSSLNAGMAAALCLAGNDLTRPFGLVTLFIGAAYVLQHYYAERRSFYALITPYAAALSLILVQLARLSDSPPMAALTAGATAISLVNFFHLSRRMLDRSRTALREANRQARQNEKAAAQANAAKSAFLARMSHEIRTPLNGVLGMAQALSAGPMSKVQRQRLGVLEESGTALLGVVNDILDLSKIEAGKLEFEEIAFDLTPILRSVHGGFASLAQQKGLRFELKIGEAAGSYRGDPARVRQIVANLVSNALKFTDEGEVRVSARLAEGRLEVAVRDSGPGIPPEAMPRLFGTFSQLDASTARRYGGSGLGLAICHQLAALMGGEIAVESQPGLGSTFTLCLPLVRMGDEGPQRDGGAGTEFAMPMRADARLLVAEDNAINQLVLLTLLQPSGATPTFVDDGAAAVSAWEDGDWDAILMDIEMPGLDGRQAAALIRRRERESGRPRTPIVALTANAMAHQVREYLDVGMDDFISKPIDARRLYQVLCGVLDCAPAALEAAAAASVAGG